MKKKQLLLQLFLLVFSLPFLHKALASHEIGSTITYVCVAPATYQVTLHMYRDCSGVVSAPTHVLNIAASGCNTGRDITLNKIGTGRFGDPYCVGVGNACNTTSRPNYEEVRYEGTVTFTTSEQTCTDWVLSAISTGNTRPITDNLVNGQGMYNEAFLKLGGNLNNSSPVLHSMDDPVPIFCVAQVSQYIVNASDPDCDSLSYELVAPLAAANTPVTYKLIPVNTSGGMIMNPNPKPPYNTTFNPQYANIPAFGPDFSPQFPIPSLIVNWDSQPVVQGQAKVYIDQQKGGLRLMPVYYNSTAMGINKYAVTVQIKEWRMVNGTMTNIGAIRRDLLFRVEDCGGNELPYISPPFIPGSPFMPDTTGIITVSPGTQLNLQFTTTDSDNNSVLTVESDITSVLPGAQLSLTTANHPVGTISWVAAPDPNCTAVRYYRVRVSDDACPLKGKQDFLVGIRVDANAAPLSRSKEVVHAGSFTAYPNPFTENVTFKLNQNTKAESILIYNLLGQQIDQINRHNAAKGQQEISWEKAGRFASGTYLARLISDGKTVQVLKFTKQ